jgi:uncharacterized membrane protein YkgB
MKPSTGLSYGILDVPIIGGALRLIQDTGINTNLNASPQWRQYGPAIITTITTITGVIVIAASGGTLAPFVIPAIGAVGTIATMTASQQISQYYTTNPTAYINDKYGSTYNYSLLTGSNNVTVPNNSGFSDLTLATAAIGAGILILYAVKKRNKRKSNSKGDYQI